MHKQLTLSLITLTNTIINYGPTISSTQYFFKSFPEHFKGMLNINQIRCIMTDYDTYIKNVLDFKNDYD